MKSIIFLLCCCCLLSSCYAFLQADRLIYAGTIAKKQLPIISVDSVQVVYSNDLENNASFKLLSPQDN